jgi:hypothetical protein
MINRLQLPFHSTTGQKPARKQGLSFCSGHYQPLLTRGLQPKQYLLGLMLVLLCSGLALALPPRNRIVNKLSRRGEPVAVISGKVKDKPLVFGKAFAGRDDWLGGLRFTIKNTGTKPVTWVKVALSFYKDKDRGYGLVDHMTYGIGTSDIEKIRGGGPPLKPGETAEVSYPWEQYLSVRDILDGMDYPKSITQIEVSVEQVNFGDDHLMWIEGEMKEFQSPKGWIPVKP